jgi:hypothetical protein
VTAPADEFDREPTRVWSRRQKAILAVLAVLPAIGGSVGGAVTAYRAAKTDSQTVKNKAESGYQVTREALEELRGQGRDAAAKVARLEAELRALRTTVRELGKRSSVTVRVSAPAPSPAPPPAPAPLPPSLDKAAEQKAPAP